MDLQRACGTAVAEPDDHPSIGVVVGEVVARLGARHEADRAVRLLHGRKLGLTARAVLGCGVELTSLLRSDKPWEKINNVAAEVGAGLIVIGRTSARRGAVGEIGNVASLVRRTASRPVLTIGGERRTPLTRSLEAV